MADYQKHPITDPNTDLISGNGSNGMFICSSTTPFDSSTLTGQNANKVAYSFVLWTQTGSNAVITSIDTNGVIGDTSALVSATGWPSGFGQAMEFEAMTVAAGTYAFIYLKQINE